MKAPVLIVVTAIVLFLGFNAFYVVNEAEQAIVTQFGKPVGDAARSAGLHFKMPFIQDVHRFDNRILKWDGDPNQIPTKDKRFIWIDTTARWRIVDPLLFYTTVATEAGAQSRLDDVIDSVVRDAVSGNLLAELVRGSDYVPPEGVQETFEVEGVEISQEELVSREKVLENILEKARVSVPEYGIELIDVLFKRINYVEQVRKRVYERMINERNKVAAEFRSEGEGERAEILGEMERELERIRSEAYRTVVEVRGEADAEAAGIYAEAYNQDREFYSFMRTLESYKQAIRENGRMVISTDSEYYKYLKDIK
ncbi:MAG TPA: protease modulator HflC [Desulfuromonadales bacterium]|nr:protease modulator HflC [Desulfuromonadales bacterium]